MDLIYPKVDGLSSWLKQREEGVFYTKLTLDR